MDHRGFLSIVPVLLAIVAAVSTRKVIPSLFVGVYAGVLIIVGGNPILATTSTMKDFLLTQLTDSYNAGVLVLLVFIGGFVGLMERSGGAAAFARRTARFIDTAGKAQVASWLGGTAIFFSDLGTPLIVGPIFEPLFDRLKVSREKLAWVLDSTASPVAVLIPITGWAVYVMGLLRKEYEALGLAETDWEAYIGSIPFAFFPILTVALVPLVALLGLDLGPMARAERRTRTGERYWPGSRPLRRSLESDATADTTSLLVVPLVVLFITLFGILAPLGFPFAQVPGADFRAALSTGYLFGALSLMGLMIYHGVGSFERTFAMYTDGIQRIMTVAVILVLAWALGAVGRELGTAAYVVELTSDNVSPWLVPGLIFLVGAVMSFATGSSWGAFAIMLPIVIPMAVSMGVPMHASIGAVLSGGLFGDHASPISDTTILSSTGAGCDHVDHVRTQLPYALLAAGISLTAHLVAGATGSAWALALALILLPAVLFPMARIQRR